MKQGKRTGLRGPMAALAAFALALCLLLAGLGGTDRAVQENGRRAAEEAVRRAAVTCYALEGAYPESYAYLKEHYGVAVNEDIYHVDYAVFASNLMPDVTVTVLREGGV